MSVVDRKRALFENIERLRRVERELPPNRDLVAVRDALERELGKTVSRRMAATLLGVSHTALDRWIRAGDLPLVYTVTGVQGVPLDVLLDLRAAVDAERKVSGSRRHPLEPVMKERRARAEQLDVRDLVPAGMDGGAHDRARRRSLAYHRALARSLSQPMVDDARRQVWKWRLQGQIDSRYADRWEDLLRKPVAVVRQAIAKDDEAANDLRQTSPFAGMLSEPERRKILDQVS